MISQSTFFKFVVCGIFIFGTGVIVLNIISYNRKQNDFHITETNQRSAKSPDTRIRSEPDFRFNIKPPRLTSENYKRDILNISIQRYKIVIVNETNSNSFVRTAGNGSYHILLLHGDKSSSKTWETIGTLQYLSKWGYKAFAIDIPKNGNQSLPVSDDNGAIRWLNNLIYTLRLSNVVIISPSRSGILTLPYIFQLKKGQNLICGYVPIDPIGTTHYHADNYRGTTIPTLIVHAEKDSRFKFTPNVLKQIPNSEILLIKNATYAAHYEKPLDFHNGLRQFLYKVYRPIFRRSLVSNTTK